MYQCDDDDDDEKIPSDVFLKNLKVILNFQNDQSACTRYTIVKVYSPPRFPFLSDIISNEKRKIHNNARGQANPLFNITAISNIDSVQV